MEIMKEMMLMLRQPWVQGVFIAGEHGLLWFVPYDYPLFGKNDYGLCRPRIIVRKPV